MNLNNKFLGSMAILIVGSVIAQMSNLLSQPIITRFLPADIIGQYIYIVSLSNIIVPISSLKVDMLIVNEKDEENAQYITDTCIILVLLFSLLFLIITYFLMINDFFIDKKYIPCMWLGCVLIAIEGIRIICISYSNRCNEYKLIAKLSICREFMRSLIQIMDSIFVQSVYGQLLGNIIGPIIGVREQVSSYLSKFKQRKFISVKKIWEILCNSKSQICFISTSQLMNTSAYSLIAIFIEALYTLTDLAYYSISAKVLGLPMMYITSNVSKVLFKRLGEKNNNNENLFAFLLKCVLGLCVISFFTFTVIYFIAPLCCKKIFGGDYETAGYFVQSLCVMFAIRFVAASISTTLIILKKQKFEIYINACLLLNVLISYYISQLLNYDIGTFLLIVSTLSSITYMMQIILYVTLTYFYDKKNKSSLSV